MPSLEQLEALLESDPNDVLLNFGLAMELVKAGRVDEALVRFDRVIELDPANHPAYFHKGKILVDAGRRAEARSVLQAGVAVAGRAGDSHAEQQMGQLLAAVGG